VKAAVKPKGNAIDVPMAIASDGTLIMNVSHVFSTADVREALRVALAEGHEVFVGIAVPAYFSDEIRRDLDDAAAEIVGRLGIRVRRRRRRS
jgi:hypothetical protein